MSQPLTELTDLELVHLAQAGEEPAFNQLVLRKLSKVVAVARRILGDEEEARDVAQLAFIRVWQKLDRFNERYSFNTWLYRIVTNLAIDGLRSRGTRERTAQGFLHVVRQRSDATPEEAGLSLERREIERVWESISGTLTDRQRTVFVLKEMEELESRDVAEILECRESTVRNHLFNARKQLRKELARLYPEYFTGDRRHHLEGAS